MKVHPLIAALLLAGVATASSAAGFKTYTAKLVDGGDGTVSLNGFGRTVETVAPPLGQLRLAPLAAATPVPFFDTWNIDTSGVRPGTYSFQDMLIEAGGSTTFSFITFNSYDAQGARNTVIFDIDATGTQATGSGTFTVLASCPVQSCVWIDVIGTQIPGSGPASYGGTTTATLVPEPATYGLMALGLLAVGWRARRAAA